MANTFLKIVVTAALAVAHVSPAGAAVQTTNKKIIVIAHRGASGHRPEHALAAFQGGTSFRPNLIGDPLTPSGQRTIDNYLNRDTVLVPADPTQPFGSAGRNVARSNAFFQLDFGPHKSFRLPMREDMRVEFRAEVFNLLNQTNFRAADGNRSNAGFGRITSTFPARQIQFALKLYF